MWKANPSSSIAIPMMIAAVMMAAANAQSSPGLAPTIAMAPGPYYSGAAPGPYYSSAPSPGPDCFMALLSLADCLTFVQADSNLTKPDPGCCPELSNLVDTQPVCLCQLLSNSTDAGITVDIKKALKLPTVCNVTTPPVSLCSAIGYPVLDLSPTPSEAPSPGGAEAAGPPSPGGDFASAASHRHLLFMAPIFFTFFF